MQGTFFQDYNISGKPWKGSNGDLSTSNGVFHISPTNGVNVTGNINVTGTVNATGIIIPNAIDTTAGQIYRSNGSISFDYQNRLIYANGVGVIDYGNFLLKRDSGVTIIDWFNAVINDGVGTTAFDGNNRRLVNGGSIRLDWNAKTLISNTLDVLNWGTQVLLNGPWSVSGGLNITGNLRLGGIGNELQIASGTNASIGTTTLSGGTATVSNTLVTANSCIFLTTQGGTLTNVGAPYISARSAGTSFTITSTNVLDASKVGWHIIEPV